MKQKEKWAENYSNPLANYRIYLSTELKNAWLDGFNAAKKATADRFSNYVPESTFNKLNVIEIIKLIGEE